MTEQTKQLVRSLRELPGVAVTGRTAWYLDTAATLRHGCRSRLRCSG